VTYNPATVVISSEGINTFEYWAVDNQGLVELPKKIEIKLDKTGPEITNLIANPVAVNSPAIIQAYASDPFSGIATVQYKIENDDWMEMTDESPFSATSPALPLGVYQVLAQAHDQAGNTCQPVSALLAVYDSTAGFVTGSGRIDSPAGAYLYDPVLVGKASFGFVAKYKKGMTVPSGDTQFQFNAAQFNFTSTSYDWLIVSGSNKAQFKGTGSIEGRTEVYSFILTAVDGGLKGTDLFRIKIWNENDSAVIYDNKSGFDNSIDIPGTEILTGNIVIHTK